MSLFEWATQAKGRISRGNLVVEWKMGRFGVDLDEGAIDFFVICENRGNRVNLSRMVTRDEPSFTQFFIIHNKDVLAGA